MGPVAGRIRRQVPDSAMASAKRAAWAGWVVRPEVPEGGTGSGCRYYRQGAGRMGGFSMARRVRCSSISLMSTAGAAVDTGT